MFNITKDCDGVLSHSVVPVSRGTNRMVKEAGYRFRVKPGDFNSFNYVYETVLAKTGDRKLAARASDLWFTPRVLRLAPPCSGAVWAAYLTKALGEEQFTITSRNPLDLESPEAWREMKESTADWLEEYFPFMADEKHLRIREFGDRRNGDRFKLDNLAELTPAAHFEDNTETVAFLLKPKNKERIPNTRICLVTTPMNEGDNVAHLPGCYRVEPGIGIMVATLASIRERRLKGR